MKQVTAIILAGGKSSRMGTDKGIIKLGKASMIQHVINAVKDLVDEIIIIANNDNYNNLGYKIFSDIYKDCGPIAGIYTGLLNSKSNINIILSCDIPLIKKEILNQLINEAIGFDVVLPTTNNESHPLCAVYNKNILPQLIKQIGLKEYKLKELIPMLKHKEIYFSDEYLFTNANTQTDIQLLKEEI